jgi:hypothetical protein
MYTSKIIFFHYPNDPAYSFTDLSASFIHVGGFNVYK